MSVTVPARKDCPTCMGAGCKVEADGRLLACMPCFVAAASGAITRAHDDFVAAYRRSSHFTPYIPAQLRTDN